MSLAVSDLHAAYDRFEVLNGLSLEVQPGTIHVLLGRNGAGKTTTLRTNYGLMGPLAQSRSTAPRWGSRAACFTRAGLGYVPKYGASSAT